MKQFEITRLSGGPTPEKCGHYRREVREILKQMDAGEAVMINGRKGQKHVMDMSVKDAYRITGGGEGFLHDFGVEAPEELPDEPYSVLVDISDIEESNRNLDETRKGLELVKNMTVGEIRSVNGRKFQKMDTGYTWRQYFSHSTKEKGPGPGWDTRLSILEALELSDVNDLPDEPYYRLDEVEGVNGL